MIFSQTWFGLWGSMLGGVESFRSQLAQHLQFLLGRRLGHAEVSGEFERKPGIILNLLPADAGIERDHLHAPLFIVEAKHCEIGDHAEHAAGEEDRKSTRL